MQEPHPPVLPVPLAVVEQNTFSLIGLPEFHDQGTEAQGMALLSERLLATGADTHTDADAESVLRVIAHEFLHTWSGAPQLSVIVRIAGGGGLRAKGGDAFTAAAAAAACWVHQRRL